MQHSSNPGMLPVKADWNLCNKRESWRGATAKAAQFSHYIAGYRARHTCRSEFATDLRDLAEPSDFLRLFILAILFFMDLFIFPSTRSPATPCSMTVESLGDGGGSWREAAAAAAARALAPEGSGGLPMSTSLPGMLPRFTCTVGTASCREGLCKDLNCGCCCSQRCFNSEPWSIHDCC